MRKGIFWKETKYFINVNEDPYNFARFKAHNNSECCFVEATVVSLWRNNNEIPLLFEEEYSSSSSSSIVDSSMFLSTRSQAKKRDQGMYTNLLNAERICQKFVRYVVCRTWRQQNMYKDRVIQHRASGTNFSQMWSYGNRMGGGDRNFFSVHNI